MAIISIWAEPAEQDVEKLRELNAYFYETLGGALVVPHITVRGAIDANEDEAIEKVRDIAAQSAAFIATLTRIGTNDVWNQALYLNADAPIEAPRALVDAAFGLDHKEFFAHFSLAYGSFDEDALKSAVRESDLNLPMQVGFDRLTLWSTANQDERDVVDWRQLASFALNG